MAQKVFFFCSNLFENLRIIEGKPSDIEFLDTKMNLPIIETANSEGRLYIRQFRKFSPDKKVGVKKDKDGVIL
jgi:hypothetical protein